MYGERLSAKMDGDKVDFCNEQIALLPSEAVVADHGVLVVSDLHLGKGILLRDGGVPLTDDFDAPTIAKLVTDIDLFHHGA